MKYIFSLVYFLLFLRFCTHYITNVIIKRFIYQNTVLYFKWKRVLNKKLSLATRRWRNVLIVHEPEEGTIIALWLFSMLWRAYSLVYSIFFEHINTNIKTWLYLPELTQITFALLQRGSLTKNPFLVCSFPKAQLFPI